VKTLCIAFVMGPLQIQSTEPTQCARTSKTAIPLCQIKT